MYLRINVTRTAMSTKLLLGVKKLKTKAECLLSFSVLKNFVADVVKKSFTNSKHSIVIFSQLIPPPTIFKQTLLFSFKFLTDIENEVAGFESKAYSIRPYQRCCVISNIRDLARVPAVHSIVCRNIA